MSPRLEQLNTVNKSILMSGDHLALNLLAEKGTTYLFWTIIHMKRQLHS